jgi:hypothetical protein
VIKAIVSYEESRAWVTVDETVTDEMLIQVVERLRYSARILERK